MPIERDIDVALAVQLAGMPLEEFQYLNPQMNRPVILAAGTPQILLPYDNANRFVRELPQHRGPLATWTAWVAPKTHEDRRRGARHRHGRGAACARSTDIPARMLIKAGSTLLVPRAQRAARRRLGHRSPTTRRWRSPPTRRRCARWRCKAGKKDSVASVARRYRVSAAQVAQWNDVGAGAQFAPGQTVVVYVAAKAARAPRRRSDARATEHSTRVVGTAPAHGEAAARPPTAQLTAP